MHLNCHSYFSLRYGVMSPRELVQEATKHVEITHLALTDINNVSGASDFILNCQEAGLHPVSGIEYRHHGELLGIGIARNETGFEILNRCLSHGPRDVSTLRRECASSDVYLIYPLDAPWSALEEHERFGVCPWETPFVSNLPLLDNYVSLWPVVLRSTKDWETHRMLRAIDQQMLASSNQLHCCHPDAMMHDPMSLAKRYACCPALVRNGEAVIKSCDPAIELGKNRNRKIYSATKSQDHRKLLALSERGRRMRYGEDDRASAVQMSEELKVIARHNLEAYFLTCWDITTYARRNAIAHVGRGSGGNSIVAYALGISNVDPIRLGLRFDRFLSAERADPPDFDLDFSWQHRDQILQYIFDRFGANHVALLATFQTFKGRSIVWELGKIFGLTRQEIKCIIDHPLQRHRHHPLGNLIFDRGKALIGLPNYLSMHSGGVVLSQAPLTQITALKPMAKGFPIVHFDKRQAKTLGLHKYDILSQRALGYIDDACALLGRTPAMIPPIEILERDQRTMSLLQQGETVGSFYVESPAMRNLLQKVPTHDYRRLVDVTSIIRPGVAKSGMMDAYI
ncbi:MAG: PHP domain-containing protein, partial [Saprospiraceae bacterium]|nr:PHP domain-containing protein [Saprospiraceae bacterium]